MRNGSDDLIILYGSLRASEPSFREINLHENLIGLGPVKFPGRLLDLGAYPGALLGGTKLIDGELFQLRNRSSLADLDAFELYRSGDTRPLNRSQGTGSLYIRKKTSYTTRDGGSGEAQVYEYNGELVDGIARPAPEIEATDWIDYLLSKDRRGAT